MRASTYNESIQRLSAADRSAVPTHVRDQLSAASNHALKMTTEAMAGRELREVSFANNKKIEALTIGFYFEAEVMCLCVQETIQPVVSFPAIKMISCGNCAYGIIEVFSSHERLSQDHKCDICETETPEGKLYPDVILSANITTSVLTCDRCHTWLASDDQEWPV